MLNTIKTHVLLPLFQRVGTASATVLIGYGFQADIAHATGAFVAAGAGVVFDLVQDYLRLRKAKKKAVFEALTEHPDGGVTVSLETINGFAGGRFK